ncbi:MAG: hypothetical protein AB7H71_12775 [Alphaproteobacteria bacterium]
MLLISCRSSKSRLEQEKPADRIPETQTKAAPLSDDRNIVDLAPGAAFC